MVAKITVAYTRDDDGIHLWCDRCKVYISLGFDPEVKDLVLAEAEHRREHW